jgi:hypothetical protein
MALGAGGTAKAFPLKLTLGLPLAKAIVVPILNVAAPAEAALNLMVRGELTDLNSAMGKSDSEEVPTV